MGLPSWIRLLSDTEYEPLVYHRWYRWWRVESSLCRDQNWRPPAADELEHCKHSRLRLPVKRVNVSKAYRPFYVLLEWWLSFCDWKLHSGQQDEWDMRTLRHQNGQVRQISINECRALPSFQLQLRLTRRFCLLWTYHCQESAWTRIRHSSRHDNYTRDNSLGVNCFNRAIRYNIQGRRLEHN